MLTLGQPDPPQDQGGGAVLYRGDCARGYRLAVHQHLRAHAACGDVVAEDGQVVAPRLRGQNAVGKGIPVSDDHRLAAAREDHSLISLQGIGGGDGTRLLGNRLELIRAALSAHGRGTADEAEVGRAALGHVADGSPRQIAVGDLAQQAVVHVEGVVSAAPLDLEGLETVETGVLPEGAHRSHLGGGGLAVHGDLNDHLLLGGGEAADTEILLVGVGEDRTGHPSLGDLGHVVLGGEIPREGGLAHQHTVGGQRKPAPRGETACEGPALEGGSRLKAVVHVGKVGHLTGVGGGAEDLHAVAVEPDAVNVHVAIGKGIDQGVVDDVVAVQIGALHRGAVTDAKDRLLGADEEGIVVHGPVKAHGTLVRDSVENAVGGAEHVVARVGHVVVAVVVDHHTALGPAAVDRNRGKGAAVSHLGGLGHIVDVHGTASRAVEVPLAVVVHKHRAVNGHAHVGGHHLKALGGRGTAEHVVAVARGGGVHVKVAVVVVDLGGVSAAGELVACTEALVGPVHQIGRGPALDAHAAVLGAAVEIVDSVVAHDKGVAEAVAGPRLLGLGGQNGVLVGGNAFHGGCLAFVLGKLRRDLLGRRVGGRLRAECGVGRGCVHRLRGTAGGKRTAQETGDGEDEKNTFHGVQGLSW